MKITTSKAKLIDAINEIIQEECNIEDYVFDSDVTFIQLGLDSINMVILMEELNNRFNIPFNIELLFKDESNTINKLATHMCNTN